MLRNGSVPDLGYHKSSSGRNEGGHFWNNKFDQEPDHVSGGLNCQWEGVEPGDRTNQRIQLREDRTILFIQIFTDRQIDIITSQMAISLLLFPQDKIQQKNTLPFYSK